MIKLYLAGPCDSDHRTLMEHIARYIESHYPNFEVYKPWTLKIENAWDYPQEEWARKVFIADKNAIDECDIMIVISLGRISSAGTNWEQGYAYGTDKIVYVIQLGDVPTSLMTFCGSDYFTNSAEDMPSIEHAIDTALFARSRSTCTTTLT